MTLNDVDTTTHVLQFSTLEDRRSLRCVCRDTNTSFLRSRRSCCLIDMARIARERRKRWAFPLIHSGNQTLRDCLPPRFRLRELTGYLDYQVRGAYERICRKHGSRDMDVEEFQVAVMEDGHHTRGLFRRASMLFFVKFMHQKLSIKSAFQDVCAIDDFIVEREDVSIETEKQRNFLEIVPFMKDCNGIYLESFFAKRTWKRMHAQNPIP